MCGGQGGGEHGGEEGAQVGGGVDGLQADTQVVAQERVEAEEQVTLRRTARDSSSSSRGGKEGIGQASRTTIDAV